MVRRNFLGKRTCMQARLGSAEVKPEQGSKSSDCLVSRERARRTCQNSRRRTSSFAYWRRPQQPREPSIAANLVADPRILPYYGHTHARSAKQAVNLPLRASCTWSPPLESASVLGGQTTSLLLSNKKKHTLDHKSMAGAHSCAPPHG